MTKTPLLGCSADEIKVLLQAANQPAYRSNQIMQWMYQKNVKSIDEMTNLSKNLREELKKSYFVGYKAPKTVVESVDGTKKYLFETQDGHFVETAMIPDGQRKTLCLSTQVGCKRGCTFCQTGRQGFVAQLSVTDILNQYYACPERDGITNIVYMGMGEPFDNYDAVAKSITCLTAEDGMAKSPSRITVSTVGIIPSIENYLKSFKSHLAISLHTPFHEQRAKMVPVENQYPVHEVIQTLRRYPFDGQQRLTFEYAMLSGINDTIDHARDLARLLRGLRCRVNLIPCNPAPENPFSASASEVMEHFQDVLKSRGITTTIRKSKGQDIDAACGLLSTKQVPTQIENILESNSQELR